MKTPTTIQLQNVYKKYPLFHQKPTLIENLIHSNNKQTVTALNNISISIHKGSKIGIVGRNGSGKTTLLKIISGITQPTQGIVTTHGKIVSLINIDAGFHPELTGYENIFINSILLGNSHHQTKRALNDIIAFADIGSYIYSPLYTYSSGMKVRLGMSICLHSKADIYLFDEGIYAGDHDFQKKMWRHLKHLFQHKQITLIVASHIINFLKDFCDQAIWLHNGELKQQGGLHQVIRQYQHSLAND